MAFLAGCAPSNAQDLLKTMPLKINVCDSSTGYVNYEVVFLKDGMYMMGEEPYLAEKDGEEFAFPEEAWLTYEENGVTWQIYYFNPETKEFESRSMLFGYESSETFTNLNGNIYAFKVTEDGEAGLARENGVCSPTLNANTGKKFLN